MVVQGFNVLVEERGGEGEFHLSQNPVTVWLLSLVQIEG